MNTELIAKLRQSNFFEILKPRELKALLRKMEVCELNKHDVLFMQDSPSDALYVLVEGELSAVFIGEAGQEKRIGKIKAVELVGELGLIADKPRSLTVRALTTCRLLRLDKNTFITFLRSKPAMLFPMMNYVIERSRKTIDLAVDKLTCHCVAVVAGNLQTDFLQVTHSIAKQMGTQRRAQLIYRYDFKSSISAAQTSAAYEWLNQLEAQNDAIIYVLDPNEPIWNKLCLERIKIIYWIVDANQAVTFSDFARDLLKQNCSDVTVRRELVLVHAHQKKNITTTNVWLTLGKFDLHHHIAVDKTQDYQRLLRFMCGKPVALVIGGGGMRGWAALGALYALCEADIPIDIVGGTSIGAVLGAIYALYEDYILLPEKFKIATDILLRASSWRSLTWPVVSIFNGKILTQGIRNYFENINIEDLRLPFFSVSCNLNKIEEVVTWRGSLYQAIRSSVSLPGLFPPLIIDGNLYVDGGILNNVPIDVMRSKLGPQAKVIALDVSSYTTDTTHYRFPPAIGIKHWLAKWHVCKSNYTFPPFFDTLVNALLAGSSAKVRANYALADLLIKPDLQAFGRSESKVEKQLQSIGYSIAKQQIDEWKKTLDVPLSRGGNSSF
ncbi:MAG: patatin-like phospholipase family protein [Gammaproteobacteria bacterium]